jgi:hypothetical protein
VIVFRSRETECDRRRHHGYALAAVCAGLVSAVGWAFVVLVVANLLFAPAGAASPFMAVTMGRRRSKPVSDPGERARAAASPLRSRRRTDWFLRVRARFGAHARCALPSERAMGAWRRFRSNGSGHRRAGVARCARSSGDVLVKNVMSPRAMFGRQCRRAPPKDALALAHDLKGFLQ